MARFRQSVSLGFPPFTRAVKLLVFANAAVYLLLLVLAQASPGVFVFLRDLLGLVPKSVTHGYLWQLATYSFLHLGLFHLLFNMLTLWMFGSALEGDWGRRRFLEFYLLCVVGAALVTVGVSYTRMLGLAPSEITVGASGGIYGILMAFAMLHGEQELILFPLPLTMKAKYLVGILVFVALAGALSGGGGIAYVAHLGGLLFGFLYVRRAGRLGFRVSEGAFSLRNAWYRWKRRRAARKFQVYMRKHGQDTSYLFDKDGNYHGPGADDRDAESGDKRPWVH